MEEENNVIERICNKCKRRLPATKEYFHKCKSNKLGLQYICKECRNHQAREYIKTEKGIIEHRKGVQDYYYNNKKKVLERCKTYRKTENGRRTRRKIDTRRRHMGYIEMFPNPFDESERIEWHHIGDSAYVVALLLDLHQLYGGKHHKEKLMEIVKQIYLS